MKYLHIIIFLITHDLSKLKDLWLHEHMHTDNFTWKKLIVRLVKNRENRNFYFWWRLANEMFTKGTKKQKKIATKIQYCLISKYNIEIQLGAKIDKGLQIVHYSSINITSLAIIGKNFICHQNVTVGMNKSPCSIRIGDNVTIGCNSVILGGEINIGDNAYVGAFTFINEDIPENTTVITKKSNCYLNK